MNRKSPSFVLLAVVLAAAAFPVRSADTLPGAVAQAVAYFPDLRTATARVVAAEAQAGQAYADWLPTVSASIGEGRETSSNASTRALNNDITLTRAEREVTVSQLVYDGGAASGQIQRYRARTAGAGYNVRNAAEQLGARTAQAYTDVVRLREQLAIARENVNTHRNTLADVTLLADAGRGRRADVMQAEARLALAVATVEQLEGQLRQAEAAYRYFTGRRPADLMPPASLAPALPAQIDAAIDAMLEEHPAVQAARKEVEAAQFDRDSARARRNAPRVAIEGGASRNRDMDGVRGENADRYAMLRMRYALFRGNGDDERVREAQARVDEALAELARVRNDTTRDLRQAWDTLIADRQRLPQLERYAQASADVAEAYRLQFQLGQRTLLDVLNAENERYGARGNLVAGRAAVWAGEARVLAGLGRLLDTLAVPAPGAATAESRP